MADLSNKNVIKLVDISGSQYELNSTYLDGLTLDEVIAKAIDEGKFAHFQIVTNLPATGESNVIYLMLSNNGEGNSYDEYIYVNRAWEKVGNTDIDLSDYVKKGDTIGNISITTSGSTGGQEMTTLPVGGYGAVIDGYATYKEVTTIQSATLSYDSVNTGNGGEHGHTFTGTPATLSISVEGSAESVGHSHTVTPTLVDVIGVVTTTPTNISSSPASTASDGKHSHGISFASHEHATAVKAVTSVSSSATENVVKSVDTSPVSVLSEVAGNTSAISQITNVGTLPTTDTRTASSVASVSNGILYIGTAIGGGTSTPSTIPVITSVGTLPSVSSIDVVTSLTPKSTEVVSSVSITETAAAITAISSETADVAGADDTATITVNTSEDKGHTHSINGTTVSVITSVSTTPVQAIGDVAISGGSHSHDVSADGIVSYTPAGTLDVAPDHKHSYSKPKDHTHGFVTTNSQAVITGTAAVSEHAHTVDLVEHTHTIEHTHTA
jgi:hypothetical protein